ncbi:uncharacterized protein LOC129794722 [Lutzomyia longipalpis]|uniref:uncharacterized protein LOC129794722 n=1 Tax=Lutzomyia longipalpis TaxID=7200 RepID=UPI0024844AD4|nr:uncharacterized protein LOC129794722 [Lutzomyia longipalpis]
MNSCIYLNPSNGQDAEDASKTRRSLGRGNQGQKNASSVTPVVSFEEISLREIRDYMRNNKQCQICDEYFTTALKFANHITNHFYGDVYTCPRCSKAVLSRKSLQDHLKQHTTPLWRDVNVGRGSAEIISRGGVSIRAVKDDSIQRAGANHHVKELPGVRTPPIVRNLHSNGNLRDVKSPSTVGSLPVAKKLPLAGSLPSARSLPVTNGTAIVKAKPQIHKNLPLLKDVSIKSIPSTKTINPPPDPDVSIQMIYFCTKCGLMSDNKQEYEAHRVSHEVPKPHKRNLIPDVKESSNKRLNTGQGLPGINSTHRAIPRSAAQTTIYRPFFSCQYCSVKLPSMLILTHHEKSHRFGRFFVCLTCGNTFQSGPKLRQHVNEKHRMMSLKPQGSRMSGEREHSGILRDSIPGDRQKGQNGTFGKIL